MPSATFPSYFPDSCPPTDSEDASGEVYRIVEGCSITDDDFKSYEELQLGKNVTPCRRCGVSVFDTFAAAKHLMGLKPTIGTAVSRGTLSAAAGKMKLTNPKTGHLEWWPYEHVNRRSYFNDPEPPCP